MRYLLQAGQFDWNKQSRFVSISDFEDSLICGGEIELQQKGNVYNISRQHSDVFAISHSRKRETETAYSSPDELVGITGFRQPFKGGYYTS